MIEAGHKTNAWKKARKRLEKIYAHQGIMRCEFCRGDWMLSFHHLDKRSRTGGGTHTFEATRLLCSICHDLAEYDEEFNDRLRRLR